MSEKDNAVPFAQEVWDKFSQMDTEKFQKTLTIKGKGGNREAQYLPWGRALLILKREYPRSQIVHAADIIHPDESMEVSVDVHIVGEKEHERFVASARLPVMSGYSFSAVKNPDARDINDARQRCFVKAMAMGAGLALNLWSEDYRPVGTLSDPISAKQVAELDALIEETKSSKAAFLEFAGVEALTDVLVEDFPKVRSMLEFKKRQQEAA